MEPVTHLITGACLARAGFNRKAAYATLAMTLAAEAPDLDTLWAADGPVAAFQHHRGITHTLLGLPFEGLVVLGAVWLVHRWRVRRARAAANQVGVDASRPTRRGSADCAAADGGAGALGAAVWICADRAAQPSAAGLDEQLRTAALLPVQPTGMRTRLCSSSSRCCSWCCWLRWLLPRCLG